jgi:2-dehydropantoate 2-reductase
VGALGAANLSYLLERDPALDLSVIASGHRAERLRCQGVTVNGVHYAPAVLDPSFPGADRGLLDLILVAVKQHDLDQAMADLEPLVGPDTALVSLLNGISSEERLRQRFPQAYVPWAISLGSNAGRDQTGFRYYSLGQLNFGDSPGQPPSPGRLRLEVILTACGLPYLAPDDMERALWKKFILNVGVNQASALLEAPYAPFQVPGSSARALMVAAQAEAFALAQASQVAVTEDDLSAILATIDGLDPAGYTSMAQDARFHRPMEIELFADEVVGRSQALGLDAPVNRLIALALRAKQETWPKG